MRFGLGVPTGTEGLMYPVPYASPEQAVQLAVEAERLGFDGVWGNDHVTTQHYVREEFAEPPRYYDPYLYLAYVAAETTTLHLCTAITVLSFRNPAVLAKQAATLDQLSGGRFKMGVGIGAYREEAEAIWPGAKLHRGRQADEYLEALQVIFRDRSATYEGEFVKFRDVESFPRPRQEVLPILSGGNSEGSRMRAAKFCQGWIPAVLTPAEVTEGLGVIRSIAEANGRELPADFDVAPQLSVSIGKDTRDAINRFEQSQLYAHMRSLSKSTLKDQDTSDFVSRNLIGNGEQMLEQVHAYAEAGVTTLSALLFACNTVEETLDNMAWFSENVIQPYRRATGGAGDHP